MKRLFSPVCLALIIVLLALLLKDFVRQGIIIPFLKLFWSISSLPQDVFWFFFLGMAAVITWRSLNRWRLPRLEVHGPRMSQPGPIKNLTSLVERARHGVYSKERLARYLGELAIDILASRERLGVEVMKKRLKSGALDVPPDIRAYFQAGLTWDSSYFRKGTRKMLRSQTQTTPLDLDPEIVVEFLEDLLGVDHGV
ncbi:MAG: hypothetical protein JRI95_12550 [Deltaproteobacteria bacterium]|nr:hypothetical protein [Deltaproteobacteria bacterium]